ncbi:hypothetical protein BO70DRAFT_57473 [Aspergillus heteromorphus CBS 117.55]|uniref:Uncharacterized protein n=1 Tax=Aspergillus heteromorphus CBS 117.55 TaxID=1448321 RepID=A0A317VZR4_9EURO|nr:uncharacterized protein BO70DRAFT_57473 [Aspergillus heteromorphus CBS 117.55]PWY79255.1 hypothetical protein BO70DRAFT_57473 [Aspergillus heteromorphus CBS 117.55]
MTSHDRRALLVRLSNKVKTRLQTDRKSPSAGALPRHRLTRSMAPLVGGTSSTPIPTREEAPPLVLGSRSPEISFSGIHSAHSRGSNWHALKATFPIFSFPAGGSAERTKKKEGFVLVAPLSLSFASLESIVLYFFPGWSSFKQLPLPSLLPPSFPSVAVFTPSPRYITSSSPVAIGVDQIILFPPLT